MVNLYTHIDQNKRETVYIMLIFVAVISAAGWFFGELYAGDGIFFVGIALIFSGLSSFFSYYNSDKIVLAISKAKEVKELDNPALHKLVENMCIASGLPKPKVYMIQDSAMNAFATGRDPRHAVICFTSGIVEKLEKRELEGVIAHELSHIGNYDIRLMSIVTVLVGTVILLSDFFTRGMFYGRRSNRRSSNNSGAGIILLIGLVFMILSPIVARLIRLAVSRKREFLADSTAAMMTRHPKGLISALKKLEADHEVLEAANGATAHMYIVSPLQGNHSKPTKLGMLFRTHPPIQERIARLGGM